jgi:hypothetical protein
VAGLKDASWALSPTTVHCVVVGHDAGPSTPIGLSANVPGDAGSKVTSPPSPVAVHCAVVGHARPLDASPRIRTGVGVPGDAGLNESS